MRSLLLKGTLASLFALALLPVAHAQRTKPRIFSARELGISLQATPNIYDNTTTYSGFGTTNDATAVVGSNTLSAFIADDITFAPGFGGLSITELVFTAANFNTVAVSARPHLLFWFTDGVNSSNVPNGTPGTYYNFSNPVGPVEIVFNAVSLAAGSVTRFTYSNIPAGTILVPTSGQFWAGVNFDNNSGATGATAAQLANLGVGLYGVPTVGSSQDAMFFSDNGGSFGNTANPVGGVFNFGHATTPANPLANSGWRFASTAFNVSGIVDLQGAVNKAQSITFDFKIGGVSQFTRTVTLGADGSFTLTGIPAKNYTVAVKGAKWLRKNVTPVDVTTADVTTFAVTLKAGDANNDNFADIQDLLLLIAHYNQTSSGNYLDAADFNTDGANDISDLLLLISNYNQVGD